MLKYPQLIGIKDPAGNWSYHIIDLRDRRLLSIPAGGSRAEAEASFYKYLVRRDLEKEGYDDQFAATSEN